MTYMFLYFATVLAIFFGLAFWNYKQKDRNKTIPSGAAWTISLFWPIMLPLGLIAYIGFKFEETFNNISKNGLKNENKQGKSN